MSSDSRKLYGGDAWRDAGERHLRERAKRAEAERDRYKQALETLADQHHRTVVGSKLHDPENIGWRDCSCKTCRAVVEVLSCNR
jgi:hypothetical protein